MPRTELIRNSFVGGEISPLLLGRTDLQKYQHACESISNFIVRVEGGLQRRWGMRYVVDTTNPARLIPFQISPTQQYIVEIGVDSVFGGYMRFYTNDGLILVPGTNNAYVIQSPYTASELWDIHYAQNASVMYLCHPKHAVLKLVRLFDTSWQLFAPNFVCPPTFKLDQDLGTGTNTSIIRSGSSWIANNPIFIAGDIGKALVAGSGIGYIGSIGGGTAIDGVTGATLYTTVGLIVDQNLNLVGNQYESGFYQPGQWFLRGSPSAYLSPGFFVSSGNKWSGKHNFSFGEIISFYATKDHPTDNTWQTSTGTALVNVTYTAGFVDSFRTFDVGIFVRIAGGYGVITNVNSSTQANIKILSIPTLFEQDAYGGPLIAPTPPGAWPLEIGAFAPGNLPSAVTFLGDRLFFAGASGNTPSTVWGSSVGDYENFALGSIDSAAVRFTINSSEFDLIKWATAFQGNLVLGGVKNEYVINGGAGQLVQSAGAPITPSNINVIRQSQYGVGRVQAIMVDNDLFFIQKTQFRAYAFAFNPLTSSYGSKNLSVLNEFISTSGFKEMTYQSIPNKIIWFTDNNNNLVGLTYDKEQDVWAWHRHFTGVDTNDGVVSVATINTQNGTQDEVWCLCKRTRNNQTVFTIEIMDSSLFMDGALHTIFTNPVTSIGGLSYLQGRPVTVVVDNQVLPTVIMAASGVYVFPIGFSGKDVQAGINFISSALTVRPEPKATIQGLIKRWLRLFARLYQSLGLNFMNQDVPFHITDQSNLFQAPTLFSGDININNLGYDRDGRVTIIQPYPLPSTILAIFGIFEVGDI